MELKGKKPSNNATKSEQQKTMRFKGGLRGEHEEEDDTWVSSYCSVGARWDWQYRTARIPEKKETLELDSPGNLFIPE